MAVSDGARAAVQELADTFGIAPTVINPYLDEASGHSIDIAQFKGCPGPGFVSASIANLSDHSLGLDGDLRLEIVAAYPESAVDFPNALASCALAVLHQGWPLRRGAVHYDVLYKYGLSGNLAHLLFVPPFAWGEGPRIIDIPGRPTAWLMAVPISERERLFAQRSGAEALERLLEEKKINVLDLNRPSTVEVG